MNSDIPILLSIGLAMGFCGGLLGIGGSVVMIPAMVIFFMQRPADQHLFQASAMICNFFVGMAAALVHINRGSIVPGVLARLAPAAAAGIIAGVWLSNTAIFAGSNSVYLTRLFGVYLIYAAFDNALRLRGGVHLKPDTPRRTNGGRATLAGTAAGLSAGLLGTGGGTVSTPLQQLLLGMPLKNAISNSSALIAITAGLGAIYKNLTLHQHGIDPLESLKIAAIVTPAAIAGSLAGGSMMHLLPRKAVGAVFIALLIVVACRLLFCS